MNIKILLLPLLRQQSAVANSVFTGHTNTGWWCLLLQRQGCWGRWSYWENKKPRRESVQRSPGRDVCADRRWRDFWWLRLPLRSLPYGCSLWLLLQPILLSLPGLYHQCSDSWTRRTPQPGWQTWEVITTQLMLLLNTKTGTSIYTAPPANATAIITIQTL